MNKVSCTRIIAALLILSSGISVVAQTPNSDSVSQPSASAPKIVSNAELVLVPVVVTDKSGKHIPGLTKDSFVLQEDGNPRNVAVFEEVHSTPVKPNERKQEAGGFTNFSLDDNSPRRLLIVVLDLVNTPYLSQGRARSELIDFLSKSLQANEPTALLAITNNGIVEIHPFTSNTKVLIAALKKHNGQLTSLETSGSDGDYLTPAEQSELAAESGTIAVLEAKANALFNGFQQRNAIRITMVAMQQIAQAYASIPGRKTLLWATSGFPFLLDDPREVGNFGTDMVYLYENAWRALNSANIAIYPISTEGVVNSVFNRQFAPSSLRGRSMGNQRMPQTDRYRLTMDTMRSFAEATGGRPCIERNDLSKCFSEAAQDSEQYYLLGFYLGTEERKPGWRKLKVQVNRSHVDVRARSGFLVPSTKRAAENDVRMELTNALASPLDYTGIHMDVRWDQQNSEKGRVNAGFTIHLPASSFTIDATHNNAVSLEILALAFSPGGKSVAEVTKSVAGNIQPENMAQIKQIGFTYHDVISVPPGNYNVRVLVRDNQTGKLGTVSAPLVAK